MSQLGIFLASLEPVHTSVTDTWVLPAPDANGWLTIVGTPTVMVKPADVLFITKL
ncbi:MAG: hypothetical protein ACYC9L_05555 [Sulfuricaulis sp.]